MTAPSPPVELHGWDTALALRLPAFNRLLGQVADDTEFSQPVKAENGTPGVLTWRFGSWRVLEAVGSRIALEFSLAPASTLRIDGEAAVGVDAYLIDVTADMQLQRAAAAFTVRPAQDWWGNLGVDAGDASPGFAVDALVMQAFQRWLDTTEAIAAFNRRFSALAIGPEVPGAFAPTVFGFAGAALGDGDHAMGLLARTAPSLDTIGASYMLSPFAIAAGAQAALAISATSFLTHLVLPALPCAFGRKSADATECFDVSPGGTAIHNRIPLQFRLTTDDGNSHDASIDTGKLEVAFDGDVLTLRVTQMTFSVGIGRADLVDIHVNFTERLRPTLTSRPSGAAGKVFALQQAAAPDVQHDDQETLWLLGGQLLIDVVLAIVTVLLSKFGPKFLVARGLSPIAAKVSTALAAVIAQIIGEVVANVPDILAHYEEMSLDQLPDFGRLMDNALAPFQWQDSVRYRLDGARFADALVLDVSLVPA